MTGVFAESTYLTARRDLDMDQLVMKPSGVGSSRIVYTTERGWEFIDFLVDSRGCVLLFEIYNEAARLRVLTFTTTTSTRTRLGTTTSTKTRDLEVHTEYPVCVQTTEF